MVDLLRANPTGLDQNGFLRLYFPNAAAMSPDEEDFYWEEFKRGARYSTAMFDLHEEGWSFMRALGGPMRGQYYYLAVATIIHGQPTVELQYPLAQQLEDRTGREWETRTKNRMRVKLADIHAKLATGDAQLIAQANSDFDDIVLISTRLAAINFDSGMSIDDLRQLANPRDPRLRILNRPIKRALDSVEKAQRSINDLAETVHGLKQIMTRETPRLGRGAGNLDRR